jgi:hypothetical protein
MAEERSFKDYPRLTYVISIEAKECVDFRNIGSNTVLKKASAWISSLYASFLEHRSENMPAAPWRSWPLLPILSMLEQPQLIVVVLYQDRTAINDNGLPSAESLLHQEQIGLRDLGSFADSANRKTVAHALV